ncbi:MAG: TadE/TadG family type IV pilus assembly protein [Microthrixaceae bacterium]
MTRPGGAAARVDQAVGAGRRERGQATVEFALVIPIVVLLLAALVQVGLVVRDRVALVRITAASARAAMVEPSDAVVADELRALGGSLDIESWNLSGARSPGALLTVAVTARPTRVPLVGVAVSGMRITERLTVRVEG